MTRHNGPSGRELAARRKAKGWTQRQLAEAAGVGRTAVQYWEAADHLDPEGWAVGRMAQALGWYYLPAFRQDAMSAYGRPEKTPDAAPLSRSAPPYREAAPEDPIDRGRSNTRPRGDGLLDLSPAMQVWADAQFAAFKEREAVKAARRRVICGAKTRKGTPCRNKSEPGRRRCKFHGGMSTGARTPEGIERIREAQRRRWHGDQSP